MRKSYNCAAIDIGSNAARLLIKSVDVPESGEPVLSKILLLRVPLRLGFDVFSKGKITSSKEKNLTRLMKVYMHLMKIYGVEKFRACATSAMRDAENGEEIIKDIRRKTGISIEIINGKEEAEMIYENHIECLDNVVGNYMYVDVGGGSTEINLISAGKSVFSASYNIGTVRLLNCAVNDSEWNRLESDMKELVADYGNMDIVGSGGNINRIYKMVEPSDRSSKQMTVASLAAVCREMEPLSAEERIELYGFKPDRADVIVPAGKIFLFISEAVGAKFIYVPVIGLSDGMISRMVKEAEEEG